MDTPSTNQSAPPTPPSMDHVQLLQEILGHTDRRFDRLEEKLEKYSDKTVQAEADLRWVKGGISIALASILGLIGTLVSMLFNKHS